MIDVAPDTCSKLLTEADDALACRDIARAELLYRQAQRAGADPDRCEASLWVTSMLRGDFGAAWQISDTIGARGNADPHRLWNGEPIAGKRLIVRCLHGLGDSVQMLRFAPQLSATARAVIYEVPPHLLPLATCFAGVTDAITWGEHAILTPPEYDLQIEVMQLPYLFRATSDTVGDMVPYLTLPATLVDETASRMGPRKTPLRVGLVTRSSEWDRTRSIALDAVLEALHPAASRLELWNLNHQAPAAPDLPSANQLLGPEVTRFAAAIGNLDLLISVDTFAAHLAGALGKPVWLLLKHAADWRWMLNRTDSPWYPTMRLFRQPAENPTWEPVLHELHEALLALVSPKTISAQENR